MLNALRRKIIKYHKYLSILGFLGFLLGEDGFLYFFIFFGFFSFWFQDEDENDEDDNIRYKKNSDLIYRKAISIIFLASFPITLSGYIIDKYSALIALISFTLGISFILEAIARKNKTGKVS